MRGLIAVVAIVAVVGTVVLASRSSTSGPVAENDKSTASQGPKPRIAVAVPDIVIEGEDYKSIVDKAADGTVLMAVGKRNEGEEVKYLELPEGWIKKCGLENEKDTPGALPAKATYEFNVTRADTYFLNLRAKWSDTCGNSVFVRLNGGEYYRIEDENGKLGPKNYAWAWHQLVLGGRPKGLELKEGKNILELHAREDGVMLDQFVIRADANVPTGDAVKAP